MPRRGFEDVVDTLARERRALEVLLRADAFAHVLALFRSKELFGPFPHLFLCHRVIPKVFLQTDEDYRDPRAALQDFGMPAKLVSWP